MFESLVGTLLVTIIIWPWLCGWKNFLADLGAGAKFLCTFVLCFVPMLLFNEYLHTYSGKVFMNNNGYVVGSVLLFGPIVSVVVRAIVDAVSGDGNFFVGFLMAIFGIFGGGSSSSHYNDREIQRRQLEELEKINKRAREAEDRKFWHDMFKDI